jgi:hypothetical protein
MIHFLSNPTNDKNLDILIKLLNNNHPNNNNSNNTNNTNNTNNNYPSIGNYYTDKNIYYEQNNNIGTISINEYYSCPHGRLC